MGRTRPTAAPAANTGKKFTKIIAASSDSQQSGSVKKRRNARAPQTRATAAEKADATKSKPPPPHPDAVSQSQSQFQTDEKADNYVYKTFIVFVDDPKLKTPFTVLQGSNIRCMEKRKYINNHYLNDDRRLRRYDVAFTNLFTFPCRVFAKAENSIKPVAIHQHCNNLNEQFNVLMACKVDTETAYTRLMEANARKIKDGIEYETGELLKPDEDLLPDTASSFSEMETQRSNKGDADKSMEDHGDDGAEKINDNNEVNSNLIDKFFHLIHL